MTKQQPWFIEERAAAFAFLMLTTCKDVVVRAHAGTKIAIDLLVEVLKHGKSTSRSFGVQLVGYMDLPDMSQADERVLAHLPRGSPESMPICVFVIGVRKPEGIYRWVVEPVIEAGQARLIRVAEPNWQDLDEAGVARLIGQVNDWYDACSGDQLPNKWDPQAKP